MGRMPESSNSSSRCCAICQHVERAEIEKLVLSMSPSNPRLTLECIADAYELSVKDLKVHALMHTPLALDFSEDAEQLAISAFKEKAGDEHKEAPEPTSHKERLTDKINMRESDMLLANATEMLTTITTIGRRIKHYASDNSDMNADQRLVNFCTTPLVNLYVGSSAELRKTIDLLKDLNESINGAHDSAADGLKALAEAINFSKQALEPQDEE